MIDGTPEIHPLAGDPHHHLVQMPSVARPRATPTQLSRDRGTEFQHPVPHRFVGDVETSFGEQFLDATDGAPAPNNFHKIVHNRLALFGKQSVSVGHRRHPLSGKSGDPHPCVSTSLAMTE